MSTVEYIEKMEGITSQYHKDYIVTFTCIGLGETLVICISRETSNSCKFCRIPSIPKSVVKAIGNELSAYKFKDIEWFLDRNYIRTGKNVDFCSSSCKEEYGELYGTA